MEPSHQPRRDGNIIKSGRSTATEEYVNITYMYSIEGSGMTDDWAENNSTLETWEHIIFCNGREFMGKRYNTRKTQIESGVANSIYSICFPLTPPHASRGSKIVPRSLMGSSHGLSNNHKRMNTIKIYETPLNIGEKNHEVTRYRGD